MLDDTSTAYLTAITTGNTQEEQRLQRLLDVTAQLEQMRRDRPDTILAAAHDYIDQGIPVFPIKPCGKQPLTRHGFKDATLDHATADWWWGQWPAANLGVPTGVRFDVVDIDGHPGMASMYNGPTPIIDTLTILGIACTSRDGGRHIYVPVSGHGNKAAIYPGVDYRGDGGYVVAPPSVGANGRRYTWRAPLTLEPAQVVAA